MYKMFDTKLALNKKGSEKPIEIFIALFVILAVALVLLKMFQGQISDKTKELKDLEAERKLDEMTTKAKEKCDMLCSRGSSLTDRARFCMRQVTSDIDGIGVDFNNNELLDDAVTNLLPGQVACEDAIYCPHVTQCGPIRTMKDCIPILCNSFVKSGFDAEQATTRLKELIEPGTCSAGADAQYHWYTILEEGLHC